MEIEYHEGISTHERHIEALEMLPQTKKAKCFVCPSYHLRDFIYQPPVSISM